jgi:putative Mn2+ efflux pump MntP
MSFAPPVPALLFSAAGSGSVGLLTLIGIAVGLSADCFAVALGASLSAPGSSRWRGPRTALSFGAFQAAMPVIGWLAGRTVVNFISSYDHWVAFGLLAFVGGKMLWESVHGDEEHEGKGDVTRGLMLLTISLATSIDALAVGLSFAFLEVNIAAASLTIGVVAAVITGLAFLLGRKAGKMLGKRAETIGGLVLIGIGVRILVSHLL